MSKLYQVSNEEKERIRNLHLNESNNKKISSILNEQEGDSLDAKSMDTGENRSGGVKAKMSGPPQMQMSNAGDYHMWSNCNGGAAVALFSNATQTAGGQSCHNAANQGTPGLVLACTQALITAFGSGPVLKWGIGNQTKSCWEYQGTQFFNNTPNAASPGQGGSYPNPVTLSNCSQCAGQGGDTAWMCTDVGGVGSGSGGGTGCQQVTCPYPTIQNMPGKCWDNQQDCDNGGLNPSLNAQPCGGYSTDEHECVNGQCVPWVGGSFQNLQDCQTNCGTTNYCVNCDLQIMSTYQSGGACPQGYVDVGTSVPQAGPCVECVNNNCQQGGNQGWVGPFNDMSDCQNSQQCSGGGTDIECVNNQCIPQMGGSFTGPTALADCNAVCGQQYPNYKCSGAGGCVQSPNGTYGGANGLVDCEIACCQNSMSNWNWNGLPNPTCQQLTAKFNTPALQAIGDCAGNLTGNVPYNFNHKCRYDWMVAQAASLGCPCSGANTACCSDPGFAVGFATADPLGCFNQALKQNSENANSQGYGCQWFCNVLANKHNAYAGTQSPVAQCKHMGGIQFLTDYMTTAQSNFISGAASFTGPCPNIPTGPAQNNIC